MASQLDRKLADYTGSSNGLWQWAEVAPKRKGHVITGTLTSAAFTIDRRYLNLTVRGTLRHHQVRLQVAGQTIHATNGHTVERPGQITWDLVSHQGQSAHLVIANLPINQGAPPVGIELRDIILSDQPALTMLERPFTLQERFLNLPTSRQGLPSVLTIEIDGRIFRTGAFLPAHEGQADFWFSMDLAPFTGKLARLTVSDSGLNSTALELITNTADPHGHTTCYRERLRPQFHFTARNGWLNDPNGMIFHRGQYHLFYQHNSLQHVIGNQSWGHAVSRDLFHWEEWPSVMEPHVFSKGLSFSGSAIIDRQNRAGFGRDTMIAIYTDTLGSAAQHGLRGTGPRGEVLAYSHDEGRTFTYYENNPVYCHPDTSPKGGRDPKIFWWPVADHAQTDPHGHWVMAVYSQQNGEDCARILISDDLKKWTETDRVPDHFECIELFELPVIDAQAQPTGKTQWIIQGADGTHHIGDFDGRRFTAQSLKKEQTLHLPGYAYQRFNDAPDNRIILIGWIRGSDVGMDWEDMPFSEMMTIPIELSLRATPQGPRVYANPVPELEKLSTEVFYQENISITDGSPLTLPHEGQQLDLTLTFQATNPLTIAFGNDRITWENGLLNGTYKLIPAVDNRITLRVLMDRPLIEVFGNDGALYLPIKRQDQGCDIAIQLIGNTLIDSCRLAVIQSAMPV